MASTRTVLLSGGVDSTTLLALCAQQDPQGIDALFVDYGQAAADPERAAARAAATTYRATLRELSADIGPVGDGEIQGRNALLVHLALATAGSQPGSILLGIHAGTGYRDCSPAFVQAMQISLDAHRDGALQLTTPFVEWSKAEVYAYARDLGVAFEATYSCESGTVPPCGRCPSCRDRKALDAAT
jgi:7-cyano-7-deazaguanine synthase